MSGVLIRRGKKTQRHVIVEVEMSYAAEKIPKFTSHYQKLGMECGMDSLSESLRGTNSLLTP